MILSFLNRHCIEQLAVFYDWMVMVFYALAIYPEVLIYTVPAP